MWLTPVSRPEQVATHSVPPAAERQLAPSRCLHRSAVLPAWSTASGTAVLVFPWGRSSLASGLMEITYDTGAKVILQGPVTYSVETNGGYLAVGKLTGKLEKKGQVRGQGSAERSTIRISLSLNPFVIHTPTATVTDLGTEFGVEVHEKPADPHGCFPREDHGTEGRRASK